jgi:transposase
MGKHKKWSAEAKFEIALLALKNEMTLSEICTRYEVAPGQIQAWKKQLIERGGQVFNKADKAKKIAEDYEEKKRVLFEKIGQLTIERDFLKKVWNKFHVGSE